MNATYRWIKVEGSWEPARELADGSFMPIGDIVPVPARSVKVGPVIAPPVRPRGKGAVPAAPSDPDDAPVPSGTPMNPA